MKIKSLEPPDSHHLSAAVGWLGLKNWREAEGEWEKIAPEFRHYLEVLMIRYEIMAAGKQWDAANAVSTELLERFPGESQFWIWHAYSTRRMSGGGISKAKQILDKARGLFPKEPLIPYNLGCYECQMGNLDVAWDRLNEAFKTGEAKAFKAMARQDADLEPLWERLK